MTVSTNSGSRFADIAAAGTPWWLQLYVMRDRGLTAALLEAARAAGASAIVLTVDTPIVGSKYTAGQSIFEVMPDDFWQVNVDNAGRPEDAVVQADDLTPDDIGWLRGLAGPPVVVKGVLRPDDARLLVSAGAAAVQVSSHGGRQLDQAVATAEALPEIAAPGRYSSDGPYCGRSRSAVRRARAVRLASPICSRRSRPTSAR